MKNKVLINRNNENGYHNLYLSKEWRIAISNAKEKEVVNDVSRHLTSDESFILLDGSGLLITAEEINGVFEFECVSLEYKTVYTIPSGVWHAHMWNAGTSVLIVEDVNTGDSNSEKHYLNAFEKEKILN